ncbi:MAG: carboxypeptidase-like regulatory domain-containing protein, partial [Bacteroidetes bacterium]|nr:carboxypeptidase-like regulatory domain-containing protein [Bacteroidota bacterium]
DAGEASRYVQRQNSQRYYYQGQLAPQNILNPTAWAEFIQAWKRGDFKKK